MTKISLKQFIEAQGEPRMDTFCKKGKIWGLEAKIFAFIHSEPVDYSSSGDIFDCFFNLILKGKDNLTFLYYKKSMTFSEFEKTFKERSEIFVD